VAHIPGVGDQEEQRSGLSAHELGSKLTLMGGSPATMAAA
jgi:hypothetical protein